MKMMIRIMMGILVLGVLLAGAEIDTHREASRAAVEKLTAAFMKELRQTLKKEGVTAAVAVCHERAPEIAASVSGETGYTVGRTSLKVRNPANAPDAWEKKVLTDFADRRRRGEGMKTMEYAEIVDTGAGREFRYMKAIPTRKICLKCHGAEVPPELAEILREKYPKDQATGFAAGDLRGAFTVRKKLD
jgi:hypothetical protein